MANYKKEFGKIYDQYINKIYRFISLKVNSEDITQDLCSETFLKGWESYKKNPKIENPSAFLYRIARNLVIDHYRQKARTQFVSPEIVPIIDPSQEIEAKAAINSDMDQIKIVLADLRENYQNMIIWRYLDQLSILEIAKMTKKTEDATRVTLCRALKSLREKCNKSDYFTS